MTSPFRTFAAWSWSQLTTYRSCPYQARLRYLDRMPGPEMRPGDPRERGIAIHASMEDFVLSRSPIVHTALVPFQPDLQMMRDMHIEAPNQVQVEIKQYLDKRWQPCDKEDKWLTYIPDGHVVVPDVINLTIDGKSGRKHGNEVKHYEQMQLYCVTAWIKDPSYVTYNAELWYFDQKDTSSIVFTPVQLEKAMAMLDAEVQRMMADKVHQPRPNKVTCKYCDYGPRGNGACPVGV